MVYERSRLRFSFGTESFELPIVATFVGCQVSSLRFDKHSIALTHYVGATKLSFQLPAPIQRPYCALNYRMKLVKVDSALPESLVLAAFEFD